jgi:condensin complex subunit 3
MYFNPATESEINQLLGVFFENLVKNKQQEQLQSALMTTVITLLKAPYDSPLKEIKIESILRYIIESTRPIYCSSGLNLHNPTAILFLQMINDNIENKDVIKLFSKELLTLEISDDDVSLKTDLIAIVDRILEEFDNSDQKTIKNVITFKQMLERNYRPPLNFSSTANHLISRSNVDDENVSYCF